MIIYPINQQIEELLAKAVDEDTGELLISVEELQAQIEALKLDFNEKIKDLRNEYVNRMAEAEALKAEKMRLADRQKRAEASADRAKHFLAFLLKGEKFQDGAVKISYRKSDELVVDDDFVEWASVHAPGFLKVEPVVRKADVKSAIKAGLTFEHAHLETKNNIQIK